MKINYYTYTVKFKKTGKTRKICIKDIVDVFCKYQKNKSVLLKKNTDSERNLYLVRSGIKNSVYYLMTPTDLNQYKSLDLSSGTVTDLKSLVGTGSLEQVSYIYIDDTLPVVGVSSTRGGATYDDFEFYLNEILNGLFSDELYDLNLIPLKAGISRSDVKKIKMISQAKVILDGKSIQSQKLLKFFTGKKVPSNLEIEINIKRTSAQVNSIENDIKPLLDIIEKDAQSSHFSEAYFRGKQNSLSEQVRDMYLDRDLILYDIINPKSKALVEDQIDVKRHSNLQVDTLTSSYFSAFSNTIKQDIPCSDWKRLKDPSSY